MQIQLLVFIGEMSFQYTPKQGNILINLLKTISLEGYNSVQDCTVKEVSIN